MTSNGPGFEWDPNASSVEFWEPLYQTAAAPSAIRPNVRLTELVGDLALAPGRACDLGCGHGGDALWLASTGWQVTAVDVSATAVGRVAAAAAEQDLGDRVRVEQHDLSESLPSDSYDLVYSCYFHSPVTLDRGSVFRRVAAQVTVGGYLVIVDHASTASWSWRLTDADPTFPSPQETVESLALGDEWVVERCERAERVATGPNNQTATVSDNLIALSLASQAVNRWW